MSLRTSIDLGVKVGLDNSLDSPIFDRVIEEIVDTLDHAMVHAGDLAAGQANVLLNKGDIDKILLLYVEANGELQVFLGGTAATVATLIGVGGSYPTGFLGGETLILDIDGIAFTVTFLVADQTLAAVINRINAAAAFNGIDGLIATADTGQLRLTSKTSGSGSVVSVTGGTGAATLGFTPVQTNVGIDPTPGASPITLKRLADPAGTQIDTLKSYMLLVTDTTSVTISNPSADDAVRYHVMMAGDLVEVVC